MEGEKGKENEYGRQDTIPNNLQPLIHSYQHVFIMPTDLPLTRGKEHNILLKKGSNTVSIRPYRYSQVQNDEIEKLL